MLVSVSSRNYIHTTDAQTHLTNNSSITQHININYCPKQSVLAVISCLNLSVNMNMRVSVPHIHSLTSAL